MQSKKGFLLSLSDLLKNARVSWGRVMPMKHPTCARLSAMEVPYNVLAKQDLVSKLFRQHILTLRIKCMSNECFGIYQHFYSMQCFILLEPIKSY